MPDRSPVVVGAAFAAAGALVAAAILGAEPPDVLALGVAAVAYGCGRHASGRAGAAATLALFAGLAAGGDGVVPFAICTAGPWLAGRALRAHEASLAALGERTRELEAEQEALARLSVGRERARIARELHDIVAHHLAVIVVQAGAGRMAGDEHEDRGRLAGIRRSGEEALGEMGRLVDLLQPAASADEMRLEALLEHAAAAGLKLRSEGLADVQLRPEMQHLAYRVVQEGLTNAIKHAPGSEVRLRVAVEAGSLEIELRDERGHAGGGLAATGSGFGLAGLRERVEALGGSLEAGPWHEDGWRLHARVPAGELAPPTPSPG